MITLELTFLSNGETVKKTAVLDDTLTELKQRHRNNQATDLILDFVNEPEGYWALYFDVSDTLGYEVQFKIEPVTRKASMMPTKAITWSGHDHDTITDVQKVQCKIRCT